MYNIIFQDQKQFMIYLDYGLCTLEDYVQPA